MAEPIGVWSARKITTNRAISVTQNIILSYARDALETIIRRIDWVHKNTTLGEDDNAVINPDLSPILSDIVFHQGVVSLILFSAGQQRNRESPTAYQSRLERTTYVAQRCATLNLSALTSRAVRNQLAHLDEYLADNLSAPDTGWFIDVAVNKRDEWGHPNVPHIKFCRCYIISEDLLINFSESVKLADLKKEAEDILAALWPVTDIGHYSGPLYNVVMSSKTYRLRLIEWGKSFPIPDFLPWAKNHIIKRARQLLQFFWR